jgi:hypothetical protein
MKHGLAPYNVSEGDTVLSFFFMFQFGVVTTTQYSNLRVMNIALYRKAQVIIKYYDVL